MKIQVVLKDNIGDPSAAAQDMAAQLEQLTGQVVNARVIRKPGSIKMGGHASSE